MAKFEPLPITAVRNPTTRLLEGIAPISASSTLPPELEISGVVYTKVSSSWCDGKELKVTYDSFSGDTYTLYFR